MPENKTDFSAIVAALNAANVRYVLIGGLAMILHGSAHITQDIDIGYARDTENVTSLAAMLSTCHARLRGVPDDVPFVLDARTFRNTLNLTLETSLGAFDLLGEISGIDSFEGLWERAIGMDLEGLPVRVASLDDLIAMKRAANRPKDQTHVMELEALRRLIEEADAR